MDNDQLSQLCADWQKRLRLQDWEVKVELYRQDDLKEKGEELQGRCEPLLDKRIARIKILDPQDVYGNWIGGHDVEIVLVHELLHLHFESFWRDKKKLEQEQAINMIAKALVSAVREKLPSQSL